MSLRMYSEYQGNETRMGKGKGTFEYWATRYAIYVIPYIFQILTSRKEYLLAESSSRSEESQFVRN